MLESASPAIHRPIGPAGAFSVAVLDITGMICQGCAARLQDGLLAWPGVLSVEIDLNRETARVVFEWNRVLYRDLADAISAAGGYAHSRFQATVLA